MFGRKETKLKHCAVNFNFFNFSIPLLISTEIITVNNQRKEGDKCMSGFSGVRSMKLGDVHMKCLY